MALLTWINHTPVDLFCVKGSSRNVFAKAGEAEAYAKSKADVLETKVGRVRIDFDRMVGDTTAACEALADGLAGVRADVRGVGNEVRMGLLPPEPPKQLPPYQPFYGMGTR